MAQYDGYEDVNGIRTVGGDRGYDKRPACRFCADGFPLMRDRLSHFVHGSTQPCELALPAVQVSGEGERPQSETYHDAGLPLETEVYGFLEALDETWSDVEVRALTTFIQGRIDAALAAVPAVPASHLEAPSKGLLRERLINEAAMLYAQLKTCEHKLHAAPIGCPYCRRDKRFMDLLTECASALAAPHPPPRTEPDADEGSRQSSPAGSPLMAGLERLIQQWLGGAESNFDLRDRRPPGHPSRRSHEAQGNTLKLCADELAALLRSGADEDARQSPSVPRGATGSPRSPQPKGSE